MKNKIGYYLLLVSFGTFVPILGCLLAIIVTLLLRVYGKDFSPIPINVRPLVEYTRKKPIKTVAYGAGWANVRFDSSRFTKDEQIQALRSLSRKTARDVNPIYSKLVSEEMEEIRVCAFSMLENQQDFLHKKISMLLKKINKETASKKKAYIAKQLALLYWELVYRNLSDKEFRIILLERSFYFASLALNVMTSDATLQILCSRINIERGDMVAGLDDLATASKLNAPPSRFLPYLAEIAYKNKDYNALRQHLLSDSSIKYLFKINSIFNFWCHR